MKPVYDNDATHATDTSILYINDNDDTHDYYHETLLSMKPVYLILMIPTPIHVTHDTDTRYLCYRNRFMI